MNARMPIQWAKIFEEKGNCYSFDWANRVLSDLVGYRGRHRSDDVEQLANALLGAHIFLKARDQNIEVRETYKDA